MATGCKKPCSVYSADHDYSHVLGLLVSSENEVLQVKKHNCNSTKVTAKYFTLSMMALANHMVLNTF